MCCARLSQFALQERPQAFMSESKRRAFSRTLSLSLHVPLSRLSCDGQSERAALPEAESVDIRSIIKIIWIKGADFISVAEGMDDEEAAGARLRETRETLSFFLPVLTDEER